MRWIDDDDAQQGGGSIVVRWLVTQENIIVGKWSELIWKEMKEKRDDNMEEWK